MTQHNASANGNGRPHVMVVDDDPSMRDFLQSFLAERGYSAITTGSGEEAVKRYSAERPAAVILDVVMPGAMDGLAALAAFKKIDRDVPIIVLSGVGGTATVVRAMKLDAYDFVSKPFDDADLEVPLANALRQQQLSREVATLREELSKQSKHGMLIASSDEMAEVRDLIERVADTDVTVLIRGESGTGKELVARALYARSHRSTKPFVKVNCAALPADLLESELFGFERGAFTGAIHQKPGRFEFANHGTIFLDEISEMSPALQAKLLQVLQDGEFSRLGGKHDVHVDVRIIAATNRDLECAVADGLFREDLFFRLNVVSIHVPPLRERREEIPLLTNYFLKKYSVQYNKPLAEVSHDTVKQLTEYDWPGNVRQLENLIKRAVVLGEAAMQKELSSGMLMPPRAVHTRGLSASSASPTRATHGASGLTGSNGANGSRFPHKVNGSSAAVGPDTDTERASCSLKDISRTAARAAERELMFRMLQQTRWNRKETAKILGISYKALLYKIKENGLDKDS